MQIDPLRIFVILPRGCARSLQAGQDAGVPFREIPDKTFHAKVARTSGAFDPASGALLAELPLANAEGQLFPGMPAEVKIPLPHDGRTLLVPGNAIMRHANGPGVMTVDSHHAIHLRRVKLGLDFGDELEALPGLIADDSLVVNPKDALHEGTGTFNGER